jgi:hypothetical protein
MCKDDRPKFRLGREEKWGETLTLLRSGFSWGEICQILGVSIPTLHRWADTSAFKSEYELRGGIVIGDGEEKRKVLRPKRDPNAEEPSEVLPIKLKYAVKKLLADAEISEMKAICDALESGNLPSDPEVRKHFDNAADRGGFRRTRDLFEDLVERASKYSPPPTHQ